MSGCEVWKIHEAESCLGEWAFYKHNHVPVKGQSPRVACFDIQHFGFYLERNFLRRKIFRLLQSDPMFGHSLCASSFY